jgi:tetratricopeptide (TPR) repeat protein
MLNSLVPKQQSEVLVPDQPLRSVLTDEDANPLAVILPPTEDLAEIERLKSQYTVAAAGAIRLDERVLAFREELDREVRKAPRFSDSAIYFNRLANLARAAGRLDDEQKYISKARELSDDNFFVHRYGDNLITRDRTSDAEQLFDSLAARDDVYALLKVAALHVRRSEIVRAREIVDRAVVVDPTDFSVRLFEGGLSLVLGDFQRALHCFRIASEERPSSSVVFENMAAAYSRLGQTEKAFSALKRAVSLNPLNTAALFVLADEAFRQRRDDDVVNSLRFYLEVEATNPDAWGRLARAYMQIREFDGAITALRREASLRDSSSVWNNLGAVRAIQGVRTRALECFKHAIEKGSGKKDRSSLVAARNIARLLLSYGNPQLTLAYTSELIAKDRDKTFLGDNQLSDIYAFHLHALGLDRKRDNLIALSESILNDRRVATTLYRWALSHLIGYYSLQEASPERALEAMRKWLPAIEGTLDAKRTPDWMLINNIAFAFAELGMTTEATHFMSKMQSLIHKESYPTATLGLIDLKNGNVARGTARYREAIAIARLTTDKARLRQKLALELGKLWARTDPTKARKYFSRVSKIPNGETSLVEQAKRQMNLIEQQSNPK